MTRKELNSKNREQLVELMREYRAIDNNTNADTLTVKYMRDTLYKLINAEEQKAEQTNAEEQKERETEMKTEEKKERKQRERKSENTFNAFAETLREQNVEIISQTDRRIVTATTLFCKRAEHVRAYLKSKYDVADLELNDYSSTYRYIDVEIDDVETILKLVSADKTEEQKQREQRRADREAEKKQRREAREQKRREREAEAEQKKEAEKQ